MAPPPAAGRDDGSQGARRPRGASRCASQPLRAPRPCKHGSLRPRGTPAHRRAPHSLCVTRAKFCAGQPRCLDELIFCLVLRDAAALLIVSISRRCVLRPAHCTSPARMSPCAAPQRAMQAKRARACCVRVHMRECAHVPLPRALRPRAIISTRACTWCYRCRHCRPQFPTAQPERAIWARSRPRAASRASEVRAEPKSSPPSASQPSACQPRGCQQHAVHRHQCVQLYGVAHARAQRRAL